jgi:hypothetical protein
LYRSAVEKGFVRKKPPPINKNGEGIGATISVVNDARKNPRALFKLGPALRTEDRLSNIILYGMVH